jgi:hypothetical protein
MPSHDRTHVISAGIKALNGTTLIVQHLRIDVGLESDAGPYVAGPDLNGVEGRFLDGSHARVRSVSRIAIDPIKRRLSLSEIWVNATLGRVVVSKNRLPKPFRFHGGLSGQIFDGIRRHEITTLDVASGSDFCHLRKTPAKRSGGLRSSGTERRVQHSSAARQKEGPDRVSKTRIGDEQAAFPCHCFDVLAMREKS